MTGVKRWIQVHGIETFIAILAGVLVVTWLVTTAGFKWYDAHHTDNNIDTVIYIPADTNVRHLGAQLEEKGIYNSFQFEGQIKLYTDWDPYLHRFESGYYIVPAHTHIKSFIQILEQGPFKRKYRE